MTPAEAIDSLRYHAHSQVCTLTPKQCGELADALAVDEGPHLPGDLEAMSAYELRFRLMSSRAAVDNLHAQLAKAQADAAEIGRAYDAAAEARQAAVEAEREACLRAVVEAEGGYPTGGAGAIRRRGVK